MAMLRTPVGWRNASVAGACAILALLPFAHRGTTTTPDANDTLATVLDDLARSVPQERGPMLEERAGVGTRLSPETLPKSARDAMQGRHLRINARNEVQVYILVDEVTDDNLQQLKDEGVTVEITDPAHRRVQARIPVRRLQVVAELPFVTFVRLPTYAAHRIGAANTEGDAILRASAARQQFSLDGTGVRVGVISDGLKGVFAKGCTSCSGIAGGPIATGDLPAATGTRNASGVLTSSAGGIAGRSFQANSDLEGLPPASPPCGFAGAGAEGTALLEIVHDIAPNAQLAFANADTDLAFNQAVNYLASTNDIVMDDLGFYGEAADGTSPVSSNTAAALNNAGNRIRTYVTANGNSADEHYIGTYADSGTDGTSISGITSSGHLHLFSASTDTVDVLNRGPQPYNLIRLPAGGEVVIFLTWDDPFGASTNNYDLYLVREGTNTVVARSTAVQKGGQDPVEAIDYVNNATASTEYFRIVIQNVTGGALARQLNLFSFEPECANSGPLLLAAGRHERHNYNTATRSVTAQNDAGGSPVSVISVGAICSGSSAAVSATGNADESCNDPSHSTIEFFSSLGPTSDGRTKPDVSAIDGVSVTGAGSFVNPFFGTSAATPHVAGIAALLLQAAPCLVSGVSGAVDTVTARTALRNLIVGNAVPLGGAPPDNVFGSGRVDALNSVQNTVPVLSGAAVTVAGNTPTGATITAAQVGFTDPNQCALTKVSVSSGCSTSGSNITCPFGTTTAAVSATNNGVIFSPVTNVQITVTNFGVGASPSTTTVVAGQSATYRVTVSSQGGAFPSPVTLGCGNLPLGVSCSFSPPSVTPGTGSAQSTVTISTTARPSLGITAAPGLRCLLRPASRGVPPALVALAGMLAVMSWRRRLRRSFARLPRGSFSLAGSPSRQPRWGALAGSPSRQPRWGALEPAEATAFPLAVLVLALVIGQAACGSSSTQQQPSTPTVSLSPASLTFAAQNVQTTSAAQTVTLTNSGKSTLTIGGISATGDFAQTNTCGTSVAAAASCSIAVTFTPAATGQRSGSVSIADNAAGSPHTISLTGTGQSGPTPAGTYQVSVTGTSGTLVQSGTVQLVVQ